MSTGTTAVRIHEHGGPEVMRIEEVSLPDPGPDEALVRNTAIALNFYDVYERTGLYPVALPMTPGSHTLGPRKAVNTPNATPPTPAVMTTSAVRQTTALQR